MYLQINILILDKLFITQFKEMLKCVNLYTIEDL